MAIACVYCGGTHPSPTDVRACWRRATAHPGPVAPATTPRPAPSQRPTRPHPRRVEAGPDQLARGLAGRPGAPAPAPWHDAQRVVVDQSVLADPRPTVDLLLGHAHARRRVVVELAVPFTDPPCSRCDGAPFDVGAEFVFAL